MQGFAETRGTPETNSAEYAGVMFDSGRASKKLLRVATFRVAGRLPRVASFVKLSPAEAGERQRMTVRFRHKIRYDMRRVSHPAGEVAKPKTERNNYAVNTSRFCSRHNTRQC